MSFAIVLTHTPVDTAPVSRMDFHGGTGELDVTWRLTGLTHRYLTTYEHFCVLLREPAGTLSSALGQIKSARMPGTVAEADLLSARFPTRLDLNADTAPGSEADLKARWFRETMGPSAATAEWVATALFA